MKLRITKNSIRIRVRKSELVTLSDRRVINESVKFPSGDIFNFGLSLIDDSSKVSAKLSNENLNVSIPLLEAKKWITTDQVGIEVHLMISDEEQLHILIEKDFPCKDRPDEDKSDTFTELAKEQPPTC